MRGAEIRSAKAGMQAQHSPRRMARRDISYSLKRSAPKASGVTFRLKAALIRLDYMQAALRLTEGL
jgi:hypothetical protein